MLERGPSPRDRRPFERQRADLIGKRSVDDGIRRIADPLRVDVKARGRFTVSVMSGDGHARTGVRHRKRAISNPSLPSLPRGLCFTFKTLPKPCRTGSHQIDEEALTRLACSWRVAVASTDGAHKVTTWRQRGALARFRHPL